MSRVDKLVERFRNNAAAVRYDELVVVLSGLGWSERRGGSGSHQRFEAADGSSFLVVARPHGRRKYVSPRAVAEVLKLWDREHGDG